MFYVRALGRVFAETSPLITNAVPACIATTDKIRRFPDQYAIRKNRDRARRNQAIHEGPTRIHLPIAVFVLEHHDTSDRPFFPVPFDIEHKPPHLYYVQTPFVIEVHRYGVNDQGLRSNQFDAEAIGNTERSQCLNRRQNRRRQTFESR